MIRRLDDGILCVLCVKSLRSLRLKIFLLTVLLEQKHQLYTVVLEQNYQVYTVVLKQLLFLRTKKITLLCSKEMEFHS